MTDARKCAVTVIGGGIAGLSCALILARTGKRVRLIERRPYLGGRACTQPLSPAMDNGPHLVAGCYHTLLGLLQSVGAPLLIPDVTPVRWYDRKLTEFGLPAGANRRSAALATYRQFGSASLRFQWQLWKCLRYRADAFENVAEWLAGARLDARLVDLLRLFVLSVLNTPLDQVSFSLFQTTVRELWFRASSDGTLLRPHLIDEKIIQPLRDGAEREGVEILSGHLIDSIVREDEEWVCRDAQLNEWSRSEIVVLAMPAHSRRKWTNEVVGESSPIVTVRLGCENVSDEWFGLSDERVHWVFATSGNGGLIEAVTSGDREWQSLSHSELFEQCEAILRRYRPTWTPFSRIGVVKEAHATPLQTEAWNQLRTTPFHANSGWWIASDDVATGLPATMESAARAGVWCAMGITGKVKEIMLGSCPDYSKVVV